jgi:diguanylate cyclase (GGDEF)-like protein
MTRSIRRRVAVHSWSWIAATVVVLTLAGLMVVVIVGSLSTNRDVRRAEKSAVLNAAYQNVAGGVAAEESLERKYRLEPGPLPLAAHAAAQRNVVAALAQVMAVGNGPDRELATKVSTEHRRYVVSVKAIFAAVDSHQSTATVNAIDNALVDPAFDAMQEQISAAAADHRAIALRQVAATRRTSRLVVASNIATLGAAAVLLLGAAIIVTRAQRRLRRQSDLNRYQALHDDLTNLPNRELFQDRTAHALAAARRSGVRVAVMFIDLNRFKDGNDTLGHHYGDLLLGQVAERFVTAVRAGDSVARLGGDEFAVLLCETSAAEALAAAQRLTDVLHASFVVKDISLDVEASIGIALAGPDADVETVLRHADVAMYEAKSAHLPFATYELTRDDNTVARLALLGELRRAISGDELVLHFQPKVSTLTGQLHSVAALVRWQHPTRGLLAPVDFIPLAESTAVIHPLTDEVLRKALAQSREWLERGWVIPVAVNISARSLLDTAFPEQVRRQLHAAGVSASLLSLELTESSIMADPERALTVLRALHSMGISLSIDDFGTGYSSMAYLKALPVQELKIDRSFVMGMTDDESDVVLVQSAVDLGHNLGLHVVAEGVEDARTQDALTSMGCDLLQGYHISRPVPAAELDAWLEAHAQSAEAAGNPRAG